jgi:1-acyl-sn-glycerol-3-phosphate acyltransferase
MPLRHAGATAASFYNRRMTVVSTTRLAGRLFTHVIGGRRTIRKHFGRFSPHERTEAINRWSQDLLRHAAIELRVHGTPQVHEPALLVCNHVSWLDIFVINAWRPAMFVSKAEVRRWPLLGPLVEGTGTLFIERERRRDALKVVHEMADALRRGHHVAAFPEGTTGWGEQVMPFHANLLQAAVSAGAPVQPLALRYLDAQSGRPTRAASWVGDMSLVHSLRQLAQHKLQGGLIAELHVLPPLRGSDRRELARAAHAAVAQALGVRAETADTL